MEVITNNVPRDILYGHELTAKEREEFNYIDWKAFDDGEGYAEFVRYKGELYHLGDIMRAPNVFGEWDAYVSETFFSGVLFRYVSDFEQIVCGRYYS